MLLLYAYMCLIFDPLAITDGETGCMWTKSRRGPTMGWLGFIDPLWQLKASIMGWGGKVWLSIFASCSQRRCVLCAVCNLFTWPSLWSSLVCFFYIHCSVVSWNEALPSDYMAEHQILPSAWVVGTGEISYGFVLSLCCVNLLKHAGGWRLRREVDEFEDLHLQLLGLIFLFFAENGTGNKLQRRTQSLSMPFDDASSGDSSSMGSCYT